ncbi:MAG: hypothetical protein QHH15_01995 [Candidatus Thermoplasmatota archaeon]|jgi:predicted RNA-binding Zn-ribbon protein involved in translation (DUF1610 family)|nr:hypothetical protein [Candidatus Thermoplasmatota archaeon]
MWKRKVLKIKCQKCGFKYKVETKKILKCHNCGEGSEWLCHHCGHRFTPNPKQYCNKCKKFVCQVCGKCECGLKHAKTIVLHCDSCGSETKVGLKQEIKCPNCGFDKWKCWVCGEWQKYKIMCLSCGWFVCNQCGSCRVRKWVQSKEE